MELVSYKIVSYTLFSLINFLLLKKKVPARVRSVLTWNEPDKVQWDSGVRVILTHFKAVKQVTWHAKGDYFASVIPEGDNRSVLIHQLSRRRSQLPFSKSKGLVQCTLFHPTKPYLFVAVNITLPIGSGSSTKCSSQFSFYVDRLNVTSECTIC